MRIRLLGPLEVWDGRLWAPVRAGKPRDLLAILLLHRGRVLGRDWLVDTLWDGQPPRSAARILPHYVWRLRTRFDQDDDFRLQATASGYRLVVAAGQLDHEQFTDLAVQGREAATGGKLDLALDRLVAALLLWRGPALADARSIPVLAQAATRLDQLRVEVAETLATVQVACGRYVEALPVLGELTTIEPFREEPWRLLMMALHLTGRRADALAAYQRLWRMWTGELGVEPGHLLRELHQRLLADDLSLAEATAQPRRAGHGEPAAASRAPGRAQVPPEVRASLGLSYADIDTRERHVRAAAPAPPGDDVDHVRVMRFRILGPVEVIADDGSRPRIGSRQREVLAVLLLNANRFVGVDQLVDALWPDDPPVTACRQIQNSVWLLRRHLRIDADGVGYRLPVGPAELDATVFAELVDGGQYRAALELWHGDALAGCRNPAARAAARRLDEERLAAFEACMDADLRLQRHRAVVAELAAAVAAHPLRERLVGQWMTALHRCGRRRDALMAYHQLRERLANQLGIEPGAQLQAVHGEVLREDQPGAAVPAPTTPGGAVIRVLVVDDQVLIRAGLVALLRAAPGIDVVGEAADGEEAIRLAGATRPDVVLMDVRMPGAGGIVATERIIAAEGGTGPRVIVLTTFDLDEYVYTALRAGAHGFLLKDSSPERLLAAVAAVADGEMLFAPTVTRRLVEAYAQQAPAPAEPAGALANLTEREREVLRLVGRGLSNDEIAGQLVISEATVKTHVNRTMAKLGVASRAQAVVVAYESRLVQPAR